MARLEQIVRSNLQRVPADARLVVGVSGGADSLALLTALVAVWPVQQIVVVHVNHMLRASATADADFVRQTAVSHQLPYFETEIDVAAAAAATGASLEEAGRTARYTFFANVAGEVGATAVLVAHNADDQAETVLMNVLRGSGLTGLRGMQLESPLPGAPQLTLLRPLLTVPRADIDAYCAARGLSPRTDASNQDPAFFRNRIRHELLPLLQTFNPQIKTRLQQLAAIAAADVDLLQAETEAAWRETVLRRDDATVMLDRGQWQALPLSLRRALLRRAVAALRPDQGDVGFAPIEQARLLADDGGSGRRVTLPGDLVLWIEAETLTVTAVDTPPPVDWPQLPTAQPLTLPVPGTVMLANGWQLSACRQDSPDFDAIRHNDDPWQAFVAVAADTVQVRARLPGETFQPLGMEGRSTTVKRLMIDRKVPAHLRAAWPIVATASHPLWIVGQHVDERARVTAVSQKVLHLVCQKRE